MSSDSLPAVIIDPHAPARGAVVWLHGLGADGYDFVPIVPDLGLDPSLAVRFVFPHAPAIPVSLNSGFVMPAWYDIADPFLREGHDLRGLEASAASIRLLLEREVAAGIPSHRIVLAGFSQGGAVALHLGLRYERPLAGIMALSTYLLDARSLPGERHASNAAVPIFQAHGRFDPTVPFEHGERARDALTALGYRVTWKEYPIPHGVSPEESADIGAWLSRVLSDEGPEKRTGAGGPA
jgi:phospholipase/carboxylesterase